MKLCLVVMLLGPLASATSTRQRQLRLGLGRQAALSPSESPPVALGDADPESAPDVVVEASGGEPTTDTAVVAEAPEVVVQASVEPTTADGGSAETGDQFPLIFKKHRNVGKYGDELQESSSGVVTFTDDHGGLT